MEPVSMIGLALAKLGGVKLLWAVKGLTMTAKGKAILPFVSKAAATIKAHGVWEGMKLLIFLLTVAGGVGVGAALVEQAHLALGAFARGDVRQGLRHARKAGWKGAAFGGVASS